MRRIIVAVVATSVLTAALTSAVFAGAAAPKRHVSQTETRAEPAVAKRFSDIRLTDGKTVAQSLREQGTRAERARVRCQSLRCINRTLTKLTKVLGALVDCMSLEDVSYYGDPNGTFGYWFNNGDGTSDFMTTALDFTFPGDPVDATMVTWLCGTAS